MRLTHNGSDASSEIIHAFPIALAIFLSIMSMLSLQQATGIFPFPALSMALFMAENIPIQRPLKRFAVNRGRLPIMPAKIEAQARRLIHGRLRSISVTGQIGISFNSR